MRMCRLVETQRDVSRRLQRPAGMIAAVIGARDSKGFGAILVWLLLTASVFGGKTFVHLHRDVRDSEIGTNDFQISNTLDTTGNLGATLNADTAYNPAADQYLVVWEAQEIDFSPFQYEIYGQLLDGDGSLLGGVIEISHTGVGEDGSVAREPAIAYNETDDEYLVVWFSDEFSPTEYDIVGLRLDGNGNPIGSLSFPVSKMDGNCFSRARRPDLVWAADSNQYLVVWQGIDSSAGANNTSEIFGQLLEADGTQVPPYDARISSMGADGDPDYTTMAMSPAVAFNTVNREFLVVWEGDHGDTTTVYRSEIYGQLLDSSLAEIGSDFIISETGASATDDLIAVRPDVAYNREADQYLVVWQGEGLGVEDEFEIFCQRLDSKGNQIDTGEQSGKDDHVLSAMGPAGRPEFDARAPRIAYLQGANQYFVSWSGDHNLGALVEGEFEIYGQHLDFAGFEIGDDLRLSDMGDTDGDDRFDGVLPAMVHHDDRILFVWTGDDTLPGDDDGEAWGQLFQVPLHDIEVAPLSLTFGDHNVYAGPSAPQTVTITNAGSGTLEITGVALLSGTEFAIASDTGEPTLGAGATRTVDIEFDPTSVGLKTDTLRITSNDAYDPIIDVPVGGTGVAQDIDVSPLSLVFGDWDVEAGPTAPQSITITNMGTDVLTIDAVSVTDPTKTAAEFPIVFDSGEPTLNPTETRTVEIAFDPIFIAPSQAICRIESDDPNTPVIDVPLSGTGLAPPYVNIPDANYKACLVAVYDTITPDGEISVLEAENIADVTCTGLGIQDITGTEMFVNLVNLNVADNLIAWLPDLSGLMSLLTVNCSTNRITGIETPSRALALPPNLQWLFLDHNQLTMLPPEIADLWFLVELDVSFNQIGSLPDVWHSFSILEVLNLQSNRLDALPVSVGLMPAILTLDVGANRLTELPSFDPTCPLDALFADRNLIDTLPNLPDLANLGTVILSRNTLTDLTELVAHPTLGTAAPHVLHVDRNLLTSANCPDIETLETRFLASGAEFIYNPQGHYSSIWPTFTLWPAENVLYFVDLLNTAAFEYDLICPQPAAGVYRKNNRRSLPGGNRP